VLQRVSLRVRLILGIIVLAAVGLAVADVATYSSLRSFLVRQTDTSLDAAHQSVSGALFHAPRGGGGAENPPPPRASGDAPDVGMGPLTTAARGDYIELRRLDGTVLHAGLAPQFEGSKAPSPPNLPKLISLPPAPAGLDRVRYFTVSAKSGDGRYRVRASIEAQAPNDILIVAAPLNGVDGTLHHLLLIELLVTGAVLAGIGLVGMWVIRLGLRPLAAIGTTASKIAAGDLSQRVERAEDRTEVGRLGLALNAMLGRIESAAEARDASLRALEASERKLRRFVADASHELRTPLAAVRAYAELFTRGAADRPADLARSMQGITRESERMSLLVDDLLLLAHLDEGRPLAEDTIALDTLLAEAVETAQAVEPERPIELETVPVTITGDGHRLRQAVDNLLANIRAHTPPGSAVRVTLSRTEDAIVIAVTDSGPGLSPEQTAHVFERFYRADESRARTSGGAGLGLAIVAAVAEAHGGRAIVEAAPGGGASFRIELPLDGRAT
jgi:two-component system OmpR family sensor kinase